jgi:uncharacterized protein (TIGR03382 family)
MLLHNLYAIATPGTWNGSPDADPCAPVAPDGAPVVEGDAGVDPGTPVDPPTGGCGCHAQSGAGSWPLFVLVAVLLRRRRSR